MIMLADPTSHRSGAIIDNIGDEIIKSAILEHLPPVKQTCWVPLSGSFSRCDQEDGETLVLAGANILANRPYLTRHVWRPSWRMYRRPASVVLFGVGWWKYQRAPGLTTRAFYRHFLSASGEHSVRDSATMTMLNHCGIFNVINTGCPTMWSLPDRMQFGDVRPDSVVFTLTDYAQDPREDAWLVEFLLKEYRRVYFFPQGAGDLKYLRSLVSGDCINRILTIDRSLSAYDALLERENLDYVGTRLHGGIRALQKGRRATIISLDNRAESISMDTGLPTVQRYQAQKVLAKVVCERADIHLRLNRTGVEQFLESLRINVCEDGFSAS